MSKFVQNLKTALNAGLAPFGVRLTSTAVQPWQPTLAAGLGRLAARRLPLRTLIDVGAANAAWSRTAVAALPTLTDFLLIEAQSVHRSALEHFQRDFPRARVALAVAGTAPGTVSFDANSPWDGAASLTPRSGGTWVSLPQTSVDHEVAAHALPGGYLLKLDVHGFERPILQGAAAILPDTDAIIIECYNFELGGTAERFPSFCAYMETLGFRCADLWDPLYLGPDSALWQFDLLFLRTHRLRAGDRLPPSP